MVYLYSLIRRSGQSVSSESLNGKEQILKCVNRDRPKKVRELLSHNDSDAIHRLGIMSGWKYSNNFNEIKGLFWVSVAVGSFNRTFGSKKRGFSENFLRRKKRTVLEPKGW
jgi:hypothetical protein